MTPDIALEMLKGYRESLARAEYLRQLLEVKERQLESAKSKMVENAVSISPKLSDMPRAKSIGDPTSRLAIMFADGFIPEEIAELKTNIRCIKVEIEQKQMSVSCVNALLNGLNDKERWIIEKHVIDGSYWREIAYAYSDRYGDNYTKEGLRRIKKSALAKIYRIAN